MTVRIVWLFIIPTKTGRYRKTSRFLPCCSSKMGGGMSPLSPPLKSVSHTICPPPISLCVHATMQTWGHVFMGAAGSFMPKREEDQRAFGTASEKVGAAWLSFPNRGRWRTAEDSPCRRSSVLFEAPWKLWPGLPPSLGYCDQSFHICGNFENLIHNI